MIGQLGVLLARDARDDGWSLESREEQPKLDIAKKLLRRQRPVYRGGVGRAGGYHAVAVRWPFTMHHMPTTSGVRSSYNFVHIVGPGGIRRRIGGRLELAIPRSDDEAKWSRIEEDLLKRCKGASDASSTSSPATATSAIRAEAIGGGARGSVVMHEEGPSVWDERGILVPLTAILVMFSPRPIESCFLLWRLRCRS